MTQTYIYGVAALFVSILFLGFVGPVLISANDSLAVLVGVGCVAFAYPYIMWQLFRRWSATTSGKLVIEKIKGYFS